MTVSAVLLLLPEWLLLIGACAALLLGINPRSTWSLLVAPCALLIVLAALLVTMSQGVPSDGAGIPGLWLTPLTFYTRLIALSIGALILLINWHQPSPPERGEYLGMILFSLLGVLLTASANDWIVLFLAIELVSVPTYVLIALSREDSRASESAVKYFFLGALSTAFLAFGFSYLYGAAGTTTMFLFDQGQVRTAMIAPVWTGPVLVGLLLAFAGLAFKIAAVPMHVYAADVYEGAASPVTGLLGFVPKFAGFVALVKLLSVFQWQVPAGVYWTLWIIAAATMTTGNVLALLQKNVKRMLAYSSIAHTGYMLIALMVGPVAGQGPMRDGVAALLFYVAVYGAMNLGVFAVLILFRTEDDKELETLDDIAGLARRAPLTALALAICVFSLMGLPPTAGFLGKLYIFSSAFSLDDVHPFRTPLIWLAVIGVLNSAVGAAYYLRIVSTAYVRSEVQAVRSQPGWSLRWGLALCAIPMLFLFLQPAPLIAEARKATVALQQTTQSSTSTLTADVKPPGAQP